MAAKIEMGEQTLLGADDDDAFTRDIDDAVRAGLRDPFGAPGIEPLIPKNRPLFAGEEGLVPICLARQRPLHDVELSIGAGGFRQSA